MCKDNFFLRQTNKFPVIFARHRMLWNIFQQHIPSIPERDGWMLRQIRSHILTISRYCAISLFLGIVAYGKGAYFCTVRINATNSIK